MIYRRRVWTLSGIRTLGTRVNWGCPVTRRVNFNLPALQTSASLIIRAIVLVIALTGVALSGYGFAEDSKESPLVRNIAGTWALCQAATRDELFRQDLQIEQALATPNLRGFCLRVPWKAIDNDFALLELGLGYARKHNKAFSVRFMAGRHTPNRVFKDGSPCYTHPSGDLVPLPFFPDGRPNTIFERHYEQIIAKLADWCRRNQVPLLHAAWYGCEWAELDHGQAVRRAKGYSYSAWLEAHRRLLDIAINHSGDDLAVEFPFSGHGPLTEAAVALADHVVKRLGPNNPRFFCQANGWSPQGDWGAPSKEIEIAFDRVWARPLYHGQQAIQPNSYDWSKMYKILRENRSTYCEVYVRSFTLPGKEDLAREISRFAETAR